MTGAATAAHYSQPASSPLRILRYPNPEILNRSILWNTAAVTEWVKQWALVLVCRIIPSRRFIYGRFTMKPVWLRYNDPYKIFIALIIIAANNCDKSWMQPPGEQESYVGHRPFNIGNSDEFTGPANCSWNHRSSYWTRMVSFTRPSYQIYLEKIIWRINCSNAF
jgi:hypothetical protein